MSTGTSSCTPAPLHQVLTPGTTHVSVGFLDLGALATTVEKWARGHALGNPLRWVGGGVWWVGRGKGRGLGWEGQVFMCLCV